MICLLKFITVILTIVLIWAVFIFMFFRKEVKAAIDRDPAANNYVEVILFYSGLHALVFYRAANFILRLKIPILPRAISQFARHLTGIEIHPAAKIGNSLFIDHGMGVVIGETAVIGDNVTLYQGVTLGGTGREKGKRHPTIGNNVVIGTGAKILGNITIGSDSYVGANAVVIKDVPANSTIVGVPGRLTKQDGKKIEEKLDHIHMSDPVYQKLGELTKRIEKLEHKQ